MTSLKQNLISKMDRRIDEIKKEIKESEESIKELYLDSVVEKRLSTDDLDLDIARVASEYENQIKANIQAIADMQIVEQNKVNELIADLEILQARRRVLEKIFDDEIERYVKS